MPAPGVWGFQQQQPPIPPIQPFIPGQGILPTPMGQNYFPNSGPPILSNTNPNVIPQQAFPRFNLILFHIYHTKLQQSKSNVDFTAATTYINVTIFIWENRK